MDYTNILEDAENTAKQAVDAIPTTIGARYYGLASVSFSTLDEPFVVWCRDKINKTIDAQRGENALVRATNIQAAIRRYGEPNTIGGWSIGMKTTSIIPSAHHVAAQSFAKTLQGYGINAQSRHGR